VAALEDGVRPWVRSWNAEHAAGRITRPLRHNGQPYTGTNILSLWTSASVQGFAAPIWKTYRQAVELDAHVRKGEKGSPVVYANSITRTETDSGVDVARDIHFVNGYTVFNVEQIDGLPAQYTAPASPPLDVSDRIARAERFFSATGAILTLAHETTHWTAHESRLARDFGTQRFPSEGYAIEELVAELGAAFLCADLDLTPEPHEDHAAYIGNWLDVLKADHRAIFTAASHAQRATDFINGLQPGSGGSFVIATFPGAPTPSFARSRMVVGCSIRVAPTRAGCRLWHASATRCRDSVGVD
jgi:antirestriction protein ArdC